MTAVNLSVKTLPVTIVACMQSAPTPALTGTRR